MKIIKLEDGAYKAESSKQGKFYVVDLRNGTCTCMHYRLRMARVHGMCKHIEAVKDKVELRDSESYGNIINYVSEKGDVDSLELIKEFSEEAVDDLLSRGELIEKEGKIKILS